MRCVGDVARGPGRGGWCRGAGRGVRDLSPPPFPPPPPHTHRCGATPRSTTPTHTHTHTHGGGGGGTGPPLTRKRRIPPHSAQPRYTNDWAPRTRKRHRQEHRPQRPTERSDPTQHAEESTGDCPGPRKETTTRRNVTRGVGTTPGATAVCSWRRPFPYPRPFLEPVPCSPPQRGSRGVMVADLSTSTHEPISRNP